MLPGKSKSDNCMEWYAVNEANGWRERNVWYPGSFVRYALKGVTTAESSAKCTEVSSGHSSEVLLTYQNWFKCKGYNFSAEKAEKIPPFLTAIATCRAVKEAICTEMGLSEKSNEIVLHCSLLIHVEAE